MEKGKVSVIIPTYNLSGILTTRSIRSVLEQTYKNIECIVIDDGSTDDTEERVREIVRRDRRVRYFKTKNGGQAKAKNFGVEKAEGEFIAFNDHDDEYLAGYIEAAVRIFRAHPEVAYLSSGVINRDENGKESYYLPALDPFWKLSIGNGWVFRAEALKEHEIHSDPVMSGFEDLDLHIQVHRYYRGFVIDEPLRIYYLRTKPSSSVLNEREYHARFTKSFTNFFSKHGDLYRQEGKDALAWVSFFGGLVYSRAGELALGRTFFLNSWNARKSFITASYLAVSHCGYRSLLIFDKVKSRIMRALRTLFLNRLPRSHA